MRLFDKTIAALLLGLPSSGFGQTVTRSDLVGVWVREAKTPNATFKMFFEYRDNGTYSAVGVKVKEGGDSVRFRVNGRWMLSGDSLWFGRADETDADLRNGMPMKLNVNKEMLRYVPYNQVDQSNKAGRPIPWNTQFTYTRSNGRVP